MQLTLIETDEAYLVVFDNHPDDWVARFSKDDRFPAREWAERMIRLYDLREQGGEEEVLGEK